MIVRSYRYRYFKNLFFLVTMISDFLNLLIIISESKFVLSAAAAVRQLPAGLLPICLPF